MAVTAATRWPRAASRRSSKRSEADPARRRDRLPPLVVRPARLDLRRDQCCSVVLGRYRHSDLNISQRSTVVIDFYLGRGIYHERDIGSTALWRDCYRPRGRIDTEDDAFDLCIIFSFTARADRECNQSRRIVFGVDRLRDLQVRERTGRIVHFDQRPRSDGYRHGRRPVTWCDGYAVAHDRTDHAFYLALFRTIG